VRARLPGLGGWDDRPLWAPVYDWVVEHPRAGGAVWAVGMRSDLSRLHAATEEVGRLPAGSRVLDVPCGGGVALRGLRPDRGVAYDAVDIAEPMLARTRAAARRRGVADQVRTRRGDVAALPAADASYDLVVSLTGLHCFPDPAAAVAEMARVLRPGGVVVGSTVVRGDALPRRAAWGAAARATGLLGPGVSARGLSRLWADAGVPVTVTRTGALAYFRGVREGAG